MASPQEFPPINRIEAAQVGSDFEAAVAELQTSWGRTEARLAELSRDAQLLVLAGAGAGALELAEARARELLSAVRQELNTLRASTRVWATRAVTAQVAAGSGAALEAAVQQGAVLGGALGVPNANTIRALIDEIEIDTDFAASSTERTMRRHFRATQQLALEESAISRALLVSESRLENLDQRSARLRREFAAATGNGQFVMVNGKRWRLETYAELVAQTRLAEAASEGALNFSKSIGNDLVRISDHGSTDPVCDAFAGKVFSISGNSRRFPTLRERPPFHPRCKHVLLPFVAELKTPRELEFAEARSRGRIEAGVGINEFQEVLRAAV
jgi:hypothetical protein